MSLRERSEISPLIKKAFKADPREVQHPGAPSTGLLQSSAAAKLYTDMCRDEIPAQLRDFILFCARRRSPQWPAIYDEMTRVAGARLFQGLGYKELKQMGLSFSLSNVDKTIQLVKRVLSANYDKP